MEKPSYKAEMRFIDTVQAKRYLSNLYERQRPVKKNVVRKYANDILAGKWNPYAAAPIIVSDTGKLIDGQHRMMGVVDADQGIWSEVRYNVPESAFKLVDSGRARTVGDVLSGKNKATKAAIARALCVLSNGGTLYHAMNYESVNITKIQIVDYAEPISAFLDTVTTKQSMLRHSLKKAKAPATGIPIAAMLLIDRDVVDYLIEDLCQPVPDDKRIAAYKTFCQTSIINNTFDTDRQFALTMRILEVIQKDEPEIKKFNNSQKLLERWEKYIHTSNLFSVEHIVEKWGQ